jgi:hypothetical protein
VERQRFGDFLDVFEVVQVTEDIGSGLVVQHHTIPQMSELLVRTG